MNSLVTGSNGFIGSHLVEKLIAENHHVRCLVRKTSNLQWIEHLPAKLVYGDITHYESLSSAVQEIDYIFHLGGTVRARMKDDFFQINVRGTENLINACLNTNQNIKKFVFISSQAAAGPSPEKRKLRESDTPTPISLYGYSKLQAEKLVLNLKNEIPITIIRPPSVYGPRDDDILEMFRFVKHGIKPQLGFKEKYLSLIHVSDLVDGIYRASRTTISDGEIYHLANNGMVTIPDFLSEIEYAMNKKALPVKIPVFIIDIFAQFSELFARFNNTIALVNKDKALEMKQDYWLLDNEKAKHDLNFEPRISLSEGIRMTLEWYKTHGWL
jgi:nucleoside-diphosphate-sugar epimerase